MDDIKTVLHEVLPYLTAAQSDRFEIYYRMLIEWNERMNLTTITEPGDVVRKHFADSLSAADIIPFGARCIDVGTGAGFPGVPLLIMRPDLSLTLLDSLKKRLQFLEALLKAQKLHAELVHARAEDAARNVKYRGMFDVALSRAVAPLSTLSELTVPFVKVSGMSIAYKGNADAEMEDAKNAGKQLFFMMERNDVTLDYGVRSLVVMRKTCDTPRIYPRRAGLPAKSPL